MDLSAQTNKKCLEEDIPGLKELALLYVQAKALILYAEEIDPDSRSNLQVIKELRDAFDHLMRLIIARVADEVPPGASDPSYCSKNLQKATGHLYRAAFDALDGTVLSLRTRIVEFVEPYSAEVLRTVVPNYWDIRSRLDDLTGRVAEHRGRKDVGSEIGVTLDRYVEDIEIVKALYRELLTYSSALDECAQKQKRTEKAYWLGAAFIALGSAVIGGILVGVFLTWYGG